ncbi:FKBP-type peptidyl-prolyl cis-trans isomerase [Oerskovia flava]|uniref:FKBP-type peptidyl-prolyl cis-trans isomerase n=1 Tax=Oerskovia flava TaxID=2986422 RepID=UPI002240067D|nr:FKBP-type peptidyl-prolyl cis-trans isomerase [Oerskovia sp. JB1-3-2]
MRRPPAVVLTTILTAAVALGAAACAPPPDEEPVPANTAVTVTGTSDEPPSFEYATPLEVPEPRSQVVWPGTGAVLAEGDAVLLNMYAQDGRDAGVLQNTFVDAPLPFMLTAEGLGEGLAEALVGQRVGARVLYVEEDDGVPVVLTVDVLPSRADGEPVAPVEGAPTVVRAEDGAPTVTVPPETTPPGELAVQPLIRGHGPQVEAGQVVTMRFTGVSWETGEVFDSTWGEGSAPMSTMIGIGQVIEGLELGLLEQSVGSQVLLVVPPELGYGGTASPLAESTLVYVVDILDAHFPVVDEGAVEEDE